MIRVQRPQKLVLLDENDAILYDSYTSNKGNPLDVVLEDLKKIYETNPNIKIYGPMRQVMVKKLMRHASIWMVER